MIHDGSPLFLQEEEGIRDVAVTGVQTCALPISAIADLAANADGIDVDFASAEFANVQPYFLGPNGNFGEISDAAISDYLTWAVEVGVLESMPQNLITTEFLP